MTARRKSAGRLIRDRLRSGVLVRAMAAHSPLSAKLVAEAGFDAVWASGFELSALHGLADMSLTTMTEHLGMLRAMVARSPLPVIADVDTGFGNAINVIHTVKEYERAGAAAVVIEDRQFPKVTSLREDGRQDLVSAGEFVRKVKAARYARSDDDFLIIARTEALIAGLGQPEALRRATAYAKAGADMVLVHSKCRTPDEIESFIRAWSGAVPLALVPTAYPELDETRIGELGKVGLVIYGNHAIRASVKAMRAVFAAIARDGGAANVQQDIASVDDIFDLQGMDRVRDEERRFLLGSR
jgi:phosphoenolpyruvate phosphomutase